MCVCAIVCLNVRNGTNKTQKNSKQIHENRVTFEYNKSNKTPIENRSLERVNNNDNYDDMEAQFISFSRTLINVVRLCLSSECECDEYTPREK